MATDDLDLSTSNIDKLANAISKGISATAPKKISVGEFQRRRKVPTLKYKVFQNGFHVIDKKITLEQAAFVNRIVRPGRYINRMVEVALWEEGGTINLDLRYTNNTPDSRFEIKNHFRNFLELVQQIVEEQDVILAKQARTQGAVERIMAQADAEELADRREADLAAQDHTTPETRIEASAPTPKQEAKVKAAKRAPFSSARIRKAQADAGL